MSETHEFMLLSFKAGISPGEQRDTMHELDAHLAGCEGLLRREYFHNAADGGWVEHVVWASEAEAEASTRLDEDPAVALLFDGIDSTTVSYARCRQVEGERAAAA